MSSSPLGRAARIAVVVAMCIGGDARADLRVAIGNDVFTDAIPPMDDDGFTNDIDVHFWRARGAYVVGGRVVHRWITERGVGGRRRDLVDVLATGERTWLDGARALAVAARGGATLTGNLGGRWMQDGWHALCRCGRRVGSGLQDRYEGDGAIGAVLGARVRGSIGSEVVRAYAVTDAQLAIANGVSSVEAAGGVELAARGGCTAFGMHAEAAVMRFAIVDERLALPGAYRRGWQAAWRVGVFVARGRVRFEYEYRANESGSGEPFAIVAVTIKQAGAAF